VLGYERRVRPFFFSVVFGGDGPNLIDTLSLLLLRPQGRRVATDRGPASRLTRGGFSSLVRVAIALVVVSQNGGLLSRRGRALAANASDFDTHRDSISSRF
jgi:hypothetical protein